MKKLSPLVLALAVLAFAPLARAAVPEILPYAGYLEEDGAPYDGNVAAVFTLYDDEVAGTQVWSQTYGSVPVVDGDFVVDLGATAGNAIDADVLDGRPLWLEVTVNGETLTPRTPVYAAPYAIRAAVADSIAGFDPGEYATRASLSTEGAVNVAWSNVSGVPADLSDGDDDTTYSAGSGLTLTGTTFSLDDGAITGAKLADGAVSTSKLADGAVSNAKLADGAVTSQKLAGSSVGSAQIVDGSVGASDLASNAVTGAKIVDGSVATSDLEDRAVTRAKLADDAVTSEKIFGGAVTSDHIANGNVATIDLANNAVTGPKLAANAVGSGHIADGSVATNDLVNDAVTSAKLADGAVSSAKLANNAVTTDKVKASSITRGHIKGLEIPVYRFPTTCENAHMLTTSPTQCRSTSCGGGKYWSCTGYCTATSPQYCALSQAGYLLAVDSN